MKIRYSLVILCLASLWGIAQADSPSLRVLAPADGSEVGQRVNVVVVGEGTRGQVVVLVHPLATSDYWVQPKARQTAKGRWETEIYLGRPGDVDIGKEFDIAAVAEPSASLSEGDVLKSWPKAGVRSSAVRVKRK